MKYGTSGFRDHHTKILQISEKIGIALALLNQYKKESFGIMITASHNHYEDNGIKIMNNKGIMVAKDIEDYMENFINEQDYDYDEFLGDYAINNEHVSKNIIINIGYDSRRSSPQIANAIVSGIKKINTNIQYCLLPHVTTPELHFVFSSIQTNYTDYLRDLTKGLQFPCILDCANGIGARVMKKVNCKSVYLVNTDWKTPELLNTECSSDFVSVNNKIPKTPKWLMDLPYLRASLDGDADRIIFYHAEKDSLKILNGDYIAALILTYLSKILPPIELNIGFVYTGYTNTACCKYIKSLNFPENVKLHFCCTATGVKNLYKQAMKYDISVYFEQNGHGNVHFNCDIPETKILKSYFHPTIGDGIMDFFAVLYILQELKIDAYKWSEMYRPYSKILCKYDVQDKEIFESTTNELKLVEPNHLQTYIDKLCKEECCRIFVRASGTENCIRIYIENEIDQVNDVILKKLTRYIDKCINNTLIKVRERIFSFRYIDDDDINDSYYELLGQLTNIDKKKMNTNKSKEFIYKLNNNHRIFVIEDCLKNAVIASGTIFIEEKLIRNYGKVGHIEDIVVNSKYRGYGLGKKMIELLTEYAKMQGCYKCILDCSDENVGFYEKCDYVRKGAQMAIYYNS